jgi:V8-like Glu-specific endopeptidase
VDNENDSLLVGAKDVENVKNVLSGIVSSQTPVNVVYQPEGLFYTSGRNRSSGRMRAGDRVFNAQNASCTAGFGAFENRDMKSTGEAIQAKFLLTAGHCFPIDAYVHRADNPGTDPVEDWSPVGQVTRSAFETSERYSTDADAIRLKLPDVAPHGIYGSDGKLVPTNSPTKARNGNLLCYSGSTSNDVSCGPVIGRSIVMGEDGRHLGVYKVRFRHLTEPGDSGGPVWNASTHAAIGLISAKDPKNRFDAVAPLLHPESLDIAKVPGILHDPAMYSLHVITGE